MSGRVTYTLTGVTSFLTDSIAAREASLGLIKLDGQLLWCFISYRCLCRLVTLAGSTSTGSPEAECPLHSVDVRSAERDASSEDARCGVCVVSNIMLSHFLSSLSGTGTLAHGEERLGGQEEGLRDWSFNLRCRHDALCDEHTTVSAIFDAAWTGAVPFRTSGSCRRS